jgi:hypothetical protein
MSDVQTAAKNYGFARYTYGVAVVSAMDGASYQQAKDADAAEADLLARLAALEAVVNAARDVEADPTDWPLIRLSNALTALDGPAPEQAD